MYYKPLSDDIPDSYRNDFLEAFEVLSVSKKASAALSRRLLQQLLEEKGNIKKDDLANEIQEVIDSNQLPTHLNEAIRNIGNFSTHPMKSKTTGQIVDVEDGEAEWNLEVLEGLFDFYSVQRAAIKKKKEALKAKSIPPNLVKPQIWNGFESGSLRLELKSNKKYAKSRR
jgi:hypothetical protein